MADSVQFGNLVVQIARGNDEVIYTFRGDVDEHFKQDNLPRISASTIKFDLSGIENFNSCGIREWIYLVKDFSKLGTLVFQKCSVTMIDQINMVPDSIGSATIESFYAPYYCHGEKCEKEVTHLIEIKPHLKTLLDMNAPNFACDSCGNTLDFDALPDSYFMFLRTLTAVKKKS